MMHLNPLETINICFHLQSNSLRFGTFTCFLIFSTHISLSRLYRLFSLHSSPHYRDWLNLFDLLSFSRQQSQFFPRIQYSAIREHQKKNSLESKLTKNRASERTETVCATKKTFHTFKIWRKANGDK